MAIKCNLDHDINECPFFVRSNLDCTNPDTCSFQERGLTHEPPREEHKKEKWFEKYYKG